MMQINKWFKYVLQSKLSTERESSIFHLKGVDLLCHYFNCAFLNETALEETLYFYNSWCLHVSIVTIAYEM